MMISIRYVNFPRPGSSGKYGSLKLTDSSTIMVPVDMLPMFRAGMTCEIATKQQTWGDNPVTIAASGPLQAGLQQGVQGQGGSAGYGTPVSRETSVRPNTGFQPRVVQGGAGQPAGRPAGRDTWTPDQTRYNAIMGIVGRAMGSGKFAASEISVLVQAAAAAWDHLTGSSKPPAEPYIPDYGPQPPDRDPSDPGPIDPGMSG